MHDDTIVAAKSVFNIWQQVVAQEMSELVTIIFQGKTIQIAESTLEREPSPKMDGLDIRRLTFTNSAIKAIKPIKIR